MSDDAPSTYTYVQHLAERVCEKFACGKEKREAAFDLIALIREVIREYMSDETTD